MGAWFSASYRAVIAFVLVLSSLHLLADTLERSVLDQSIEELQAQLQAGTLSSVDLVRWYQDRIDRYDQKGAAINAIQHANPNASQLALALDEERRVSGPRSLLHGIPVLIKDNYETRGMPTTAGSILFAGHAPDRDATQVERLKKAGAIILAKTTMHEFAYGWTTEGSAFGATKNPYGLTRHPGGSSGGTGAGIAANFAVVGMGSDTCGSIRVPITTSSVSGEHRGSVVDSESCRYRVRKISVAHWPEVFGILRSPWMLPSDLIGTTRKPRRPLAKFLRVITRR